MPDIDSPIITLLGDNPMTLVKGSAFLDPGARVTDNRDPERTITGTGTVNPAVLGTYTLSYNATDAAGNQASPMQREVRVIAPRPGDQAPALTFASRWTGAFDLQNIVHGGGVYFGWSRWTVFNSAKLEPKIAYTSDGLAWQDLSLGTLKDQGGWHQINGLAFNGQDWLAVVTLSVDYSSSETKVLRSQNMGLSWQVVVENHALIS